jgi:hypothetical protein
MSTRTVSCFVLLAAIGFTFGQTNNTENVKHDPTETYVTGSGVSVTKRFNSRGRLCTILLRPPHSAPAKCTESTEKLTDQQVNPLLSELVPENERGKFVMGAFLDIDCPEEICGGASERYKHVIITKIGNINEYCYVAVDYLRRSCPKVQKR